MFYLFEILGVFLQNTIIFGGFRASSWGILKISCGNTVSMSTILAWALVLFFILCFGKSFEFVLT
jgi:hypothetical protein